ncbi:hypothetical protein QFZ72_003347 [Bacillus sp. V2I10]|nr:hypothetical protein [Bacillus sp. V2I10]
MDGNIQNYEMLITGTVAPFIGTGLSEEFKEILYSLESRGDDSC